MLRHLLFPVESLVYGVSYGFLQWAIRCPRPLDPAWTWHMVTRDPSPGLRFVLNHWPLQPLRPLLIAAKMRQDHVLGISQHYDVSNDFYELWLDKKYMFYSCADFHSPDESLEEAQQHKADFILGLIDPKPGEKIPRARLRLGRDAPPYPRGHRRQGEPLRHHPLQGAGGLQRPAQPLQRRAGRLHHPWVRARAVRQGLLDRRLGARAAQGDPRALGEALRRAQAGGAAGAALLRPVERATERQGCRFPNLLPGFVGFAVLVAREVVRGGGVPRAAPFAARLPDRRFGPGSTIWWPTRKRRSGSSVCGSTTVT